MDAGLPVIATAVGGIPDAIDSGVDGILIVPGDVDALANAIMLLLGNVGLRVKMGIAAKQKIAERFRAEKVLPQLEAVYRRLGAVPLAVDKS
jgi:glycosyltransferase involved in cell wall biosynthesis